MRHQTSRRARTILLSTALLIAATLTPAARAASSIDGLWDAIVVANGVEIPFRFEIATNGTAVQGFFFEGDRKIESTSGTFVDGVLKLEYDYLNTTLEAKFADDQLTGTYRNNRPNARPQDVRMRRFAPVALGRPGSAVARGHVGDAARRRGSERAARHADVARVPPPVGRRSSPARSCA